MEKMLKPTRPGIDSDGKMVRLTSAKIVKSGNGKIGKMVNQVGRKKMVRNIKPAWSGICARVGKW